MPDMREGDLGTAACYLTVERLALQAGVESPFWDEASLLMGGCEEPWYKKPLTPRRLRSFLKRYGGSLPDDAGRRGHAASVFADVMRLPGIPMEDGAEVRRGMRMWLDTIELPIDEGTSLERWYSEELNVVRKANESMSYACEITDEELLMTAHSHSYLLEHILGSLLYISSKEADVRTVYVPQKNQSRKSRQTDCTVHDVGFRIAPQLAEVRRVYELEAKGQDGGKTGRHVAPHVRRGHWHGYWTGPRENPTGLEIKWVAPTVVNASRGELEGTVHEVGGRDA